MCKTMANFSTLSCWNHPSTPLPERNSPKHHPGADEIALGSLQEAIMSTAIPPLSPPQRMKLVFKDIPSPQNPQFVAPIAQRPCGLLGMGPFFW